MNTRQKIVTCLSALWLTGCPPVQRYRKAPIAPAQTASSLEARSLLDAGLKHFLDQNLGHDQSAWPPPAWDLRLLTLAAFYFSPALDVARARSEAAEAATISAGARPNPNLSITPGVPSPYLLGLSFDIPIETAGKRGYRVARAKSLSQAARFDLVGAAWKIRSAVRKALLDYFMAGRALDLLRSEEQLRTEQVKLLEQRLAAGEIPRPEVDFARLELSKIILADRQAVGLVDETRAAVAAAVGVPVAAIKGIQFSWPTLDHPPSSESLTPEAIQRAAVVDRLDVRRDLEEYAAAEADLQLEIARQHPDFQIGPGYTFEEKNSFFTLGLSATLPVFNRNQGPIAEAEARRKEAAANFLATQAGAIASSEIALARYRSALKQLHEADENLLKLQAAREQVERRAVELGESDRLAYNVVLLERSVVERSRMDALERAQSALGELEDAIQRPLEVGDIAPPTPESPELRKPIKEGKL